MYIASCMWILMTVFSSLALLTHKWSEKKEAIIVNLIIYITSSIFLLYFGIYGLRV